MDFELKSFEDKINDITEQFMSLLNSNNVDENSITTKLDSITNDGITGCDKTYPMTSTFDTSSNIGGISYRLDPNETRTNGIGGETIYNDSNIIAAWLGFEGHDTLAGTIATAVIVALVAIFVLRKEPSATNDVPLPDNRK